MKDKNFYVHIGQILTKMKVINEELWYTGGKVIHILLDCFAYPQNSKEQKCHILLAAALFERISCLIYRGKDGLMHKPPASKYRKIIFESCAENEREVYDRLKLKGVSEERAKYIYNLVWQTADLVCPMMSCITEQTFISEYAYAIEYVIEHGGKLEKPIMSQIFPTNYSDYDFQKTYLSGEFI